MPSSSWRPSPHCSGGALHHSAQLLLEPFFRSPSSSRSPSSGCTGGARCRVAPEVATCHPGFLGTPSLSALENPFIVPRGSLWSPSLCCLALFGGLHHITRLILETFTGLPWRSPASCHPRGNLDHATWLFLEPFIVLR